MKTIIFSCSARQDSLTLRFSKLLQELLPSSSLLCLRDLALADIGREATTEQAQNLSQINAAFAGAEKVLILSPEYNWSLSASAKTLLDHLSMSAASWNNKVITCFGCSAGRGGRLPILELWNISNKIIAFSKAQALVSPYHYELNASALASDGSFEASFLKSLKEVLANDQTLSKTFLAGLKQSVS